MLQTLQSIVEEVGAAADMDEALGIIVRRVKEAMAVDACTAYMRDETAGDYVLMATEGLNARSVGRVRLRAREGVVGLIVERQEPVNLENAWQHPRFRYFPETGEERYHAMLGVPIVHYRRVLGILLVQQRHSRLFAPDEVAFLVTVAAQLAGVIHHALAGGGLRGVLLGRDQHDHFLAGIRGAPGMSIGTAVLLDPLARLESVPDRRTTDVQAEEQALRTALDGVRKDILTSAERMAQFLPPDAHELFDVYLKLLESDNLLDEAARHIRAGSWAPAALRDAVAASARVFDQMDDPYLRARGEDIRAVGRRIIAYLRSDIRGPQKFPDRCVLVGEEIGLVQIAEVPVERLAGIVSARGSSLSHTAVIARALGVPAVMGLGTLPLGALENREIAVDGHRGRVYVQPSRIVREEFRRIIGEEAELSAGLEGLRQLPSETPDGHKLPLFVNTGVLSDSASLVDGGAEGIGLYRTEFAFMLRQSFPGEDEQVDIYRKVLESVAPRTVTLRTLDVGGDKALPYFPAAEDNPFLGWRGIRLTLDHPEIFLSQLRAVLRANEGLGNLQVLLPMISSVNELEEARRLLEQAYHELLDEGFPVVRPPLGVMIEVPSAVYQIAALARRVDFVSVGTNDLVQFLLAVDRGNPRVAALYENLHPAVLRAVRDAVQGAHECGRPASVCGEMAGDPAAVVLLMGLGVDSLSMAPSSLPRVKWVVRSFTLAQARELAAAALALDESTAIRELLNQALIEAGLSALVPNASASSSEDAVSAAC